MSSEMSQKGRIFRFLLSLLQFCSFKMFIIVVTHLDPNTGYSKHISRGYSDNMEVRG